MLIHSLKVLFGMEFPRLDFNQLRTRFNLPFTLLEVPGSLHR